jgi:hypothetical protein
MKECIFSRLGDGCLLGLRDWNLTMLIESYLYRSCQHPAKICQDVKKHRRKCSCEIRYSICKTETAISQENNIPPVKQIRWY